MGMTLGADSLDPGDPNMNYVFRSANTINPDLFQNSCLRSLPGLHIDMLLVVGVLDATGSQMFWSGSLIQKRMQSGGTTGPNLQLDSGKSSAISCAL